MNVYDFDGTIYDGDSTLDFYKHCLKSHPCIMLLLPKQFYSFVLYKLNRVDKTQFKETFFCFLKKMADVDDAVFKFWDLHESKIKTWYKAQQQQDDVIISASPEFLLKEICKRLNIELLLASQIEKNTGVFSGKNCYGKEKVNRFYQTFPEMKIDNFYSDSYSDLPMAKIAEQAYIVRKNEITPWRF